VRAPLGEAAGRAPGENLAIAANDFRHRIHPPFPIYVLASIGIAILFGWIDLGRLPRRILSPT
jgi:hypothetical protein